MKQIYHSLVFTFLFFCSVKTSAQSYFPFPDSNAVWSINNYQYILRGDTIINSKTYHRIFYRADSSQAIQQTLKAMVRNDLPNKRVYAIKPGAATEKLLYDFGVNVGDTIKVWPIVKSFVPDSVKIICLAKDSILLNNVYHSRLTFTLAPSNLGYNFYYEVWIEGVGCQKGPLSSVYSNQFFTDEIYPYLACLHVNSVLVYQIGAKCYYPLGIQKSAFQNSSVIVLPNPAHDFFEIQSEEPQNYIFSLSDLSGRIVLSGVLNNGSPQNISMIESGIYILSLKTSYNEENFRLIVEH